MDYMGLRLTPTSKIIPAETSSLDTDPQGPQQEGTALLGLLNFFRIWVPNFALHAKPLYQATQGNLDEPLLAPASLHTPIQTLIKHLLQAPSLYLPDYAKPFFLFLHSRQGHDLRDSVPKKRGDIWGPLAYLSKQLDLVMLGWPPCVNVYTVNIYIYSVNIHTDSKYVYNILHSNIIIWRERGFLTQKGTPILNGSFISELLHEAQLPKQAAVIHCQGHQRHGPISFYNNIADHAAKRQAASVSPVFTIAQIDKPNIYTLLSYLYSLFHPSGFPGGSEVKASACNVGDLGLIPGSGRSPGEGNGNSLQYSCLENPMDRGAWWATVHGVAKSQTRLSDFTSLSTPLQRYLRLSFRTLLN